MSKPFMRTGYIVDLLRTPCAMLQNVYSGLWVLLTELYWLAGPDLAFRQARNKRRAAMTRCRERLLTSSDALIQAELDVLEAEDAAASARFAGERSYHLERLRKRIRLGTAA